MVRLAISALIAAVFPAVAYADPGGATGATGAGGMIRGTVIFEGAPPDRPKVRRDSDPYCARIEQLADDVIVTGGKLKDVLVRIKAGPLPAAARSPAAPSALPPAVIDQKDCAYTPHVLGLVAGQQLAVRNSDGTFHNVRGQIAGKLLWNKPAAPGEPELRLDGSPHPGDVLELVCDVHPWMHAYAVVQDHAAFAVTGEDGAFELAGLPPGSYTLEAWHPVLGTRSVNVKIGKGARARQAARFSFQRSETKPGRPAGE